MNIRLAIAGLLVLFSGIVQADVYQQAREAEARQDWARAVYLFEQVVERDPSNIEAWRRMSDIQAALGEKAHAARSLHRAAEIAGNDAILFADASAAYAEAGDTTRALDMIARAIELDPGNPLYWQRQGDLASWAGRQQLAVESYRHALELAPDISPVRLSLALNKAWSGNLDDAIAEVREYLGEHPDDADAWLYLADFETWRGSYACALDALDSYRELRGDDDASMRRRARIMAWTGRRDASMALLEPLLERHPDDQDLHFTRTLALRSTQPRLAMSSLERVEALAPEASDTIDLGRSTRMPYRPRVGLAFTHFRDSDSIRINTLSGYGSFFYKYDTKFMAGVDRRRAEADAGSGLEPIDGSERVEDTHFWTGIGRRLGPNGWIEFNLGRDEVEDYDDLTTYGVATRWRHSDAVTSGLTYQKELVAISPRTISAMLYRKRSEARFNIRPALAHNIDFGFGYHQFSDGNRRRNVDAAYRHAAVRGQHLNIDVGLIGGWFSFRDDFSAGYYAPENYRYLAATTGVYWKFNDDDGIGFNLALGGQEDETFSSPGFYGDVSIESVIGLYRDWMLHTRAAYSDRRQQAGSFDASLFSIRLERRF